jgi:5'-3' exonuclease
LSSKNSTLLIIDADSLVYKHASVNQESFDFGDGVVSTQLSELENVLPDVDAEIEQLKKKLKADDVIIALSCPSLECWRVDVLPSYKQHRTQIKPLLMAGIKEHLRRTSNTYERSRLEADDICGILSTCLLLPSYIGHHDRRIVVSIDKDLKTIPGWLFNPQKQHRPVEITESEADYWHMYQTLVGDFTDGYKGCPGIGPVKAKAALHAPNGDQYCAWSMWQSVITRFEAKQLTEADALQQARVARILRASDYDFKRKEVILWDPPSSN